MKRFICVFVVPILAVAATVPALAEDLDRDFHKSFDVKQGAVLHLEHGDGDVTITSWDKDMVDVEVHYRAEVKSPGAGGKVHFDVQFDQSGNTIKVIGEERIRGSLGFRYFRRYEYTYDVRAPRYVKLDLEGEDGDVDIRNWRAAIDCTLEDGDVELEDVISARTHVELEDGDVTIRGLEGELILDAEDGEVELSRCKLSRCRIGMEDGDLTVRQSEGDFEIDSEDGDINFYESRAGELEIGGSDGDIDLNLLKSNDVDWDISTEDGDVSIDLESGISAAFTIQTEDGHIRLDIPDASDLREKRHRASGEIHGGQGRIRIDTAAGDITLRESD
jgi:DUF4097 and DUF4098 domain-containing protein YvlB